MRDGFARLDAGEIDGSDLDALIHRYKPSARELWKFCGQTDLDMARAARMLDFWGEHGEELPDWWETGEPRRAANVSELDPAPAIPIVAMRSCSRQGAMIASAMRYT